MPDSNGIKPPEMSMQLFRSPLFQVIAKQFLVGRYVFGDRNRQPGIVEELPPVNVVGGHIAGPRSTAERVGSWLAIEPTAAVGRRMGHVAIHPAYVGLEGKLDLTVLIQAVDGSRVTFAGEFQDLRSSLHHLTEIRPFPDGENQRNLLT